MEDEMLTASGDWAAGCLHLGVRVVVKGLEASAGFMVGLTVSVVDAALFDVGHGARGIWEVREGDARQRGTGGSCSKLNTPMAQAPR
jgi:hypothetical protein